MSRTVLDHILVLMVVLAHPLSVSAQGLICRSLFGDQRAIPPVPISYLRREIREAFADRFLWAFDTKPEELWHPDVNISGEIMACRLCGYGMSAAIEVLKKHWPQGQWLQVQLFGPTAMYLFPGRLDEESWGHQYAYSKELNILVDPTYRQFFTELPYEAFSKLPEIFIGTPQEFRALTKGLFSEKAIDAYLSAENHFDGSKSKVAVDEVARLQTDLNLDNEPRMSDGRLPGELPAYLKRFANPNR